GGLLGNKGGLHGVGTLRSAQAIQRCDFFALHLANGRHARSRGLAVDKNRARAALRETAAKLGSVLPEIVAEDIEQRLSGIPGIGGDGLAVELEFIGRHSEIPSVELYRKRRESGSEALEKRFGPTVEERG